jgi:hypothetical protein
MSVKTKGRLSAAPGEAGILKKTKEIQVESGNVIEKKGSRW